MIKTYSKIYNNNQWTVVVLLLLLVTKLHSPPTSYINIAALSTVTTLQLLFCNCFEYLMINNNNFCFILFISKKCIYKLTPHNIYNFWHYILQSNAEMMFVFIYIKIKYKIIIIASVERQVRQLKIQVSLIKFCFVF